MINKLGKNDMESDDLLQNVAQSAGVSRDVAKRVTEELLTSLHRELVCYDSGNNDYIGERAIWQLGNRSYYHLLGFLEEFSKRYSWEPGSGIEYLLRLGSYEEWSTFQNEYEEWKRLQKELPQQDKK